MTGPGVTGIPGIYSGGRSAGRSPASTMASAPQESNEPTVVNVYLDLEGEVKLPCMNPLSECKTGPKGRQN